MDKISIAIPTYNPSNYLGKLLENLQKFDKISEIIINDDCSPMTEYKKTKEIVDKFSDSSQIKVNLDRNKKNYGTFYNKYLTVEKCNSEFMYQIDQDNLPNLRSLKALLKIKNLKNYKNNLFLPSSIYPFRINHLKESRYKKNRMIFFNETILLDKIQIAKMIREQTPMYSPSITINYLIGLGNPFAHKDTYLSYLKEGLQEDQRSIHCSVALCYYWLKNEGKLYFLKDFSYYHRRHENSYYLADPRGKATSEEISKSGNEYFNKILEL